MESINNKSKLTDLLQQRIALDHEILQLRLKGTLIALRSCRSSGKMNHLIAGAEHRLELELSGARRECIINTALDELSYYLGLDIES